MAEIQEPVQRRISADEIAWQRFSVPYEFPVAFTDALFDPRNPLLIETLRLREPGKRHRCLVFIDDGVLAARPGLANDVIAYAATHEAEMELVAPPETVTGGERIKTDLTHLEHLQDRIHETRIDRHSYVIAIGGGAVLDAVGLAAATAHRGVRLVRAPTTVLAQNDSGVGVKNAVNLKGVKNYVGSFAPPWAVLNDYDFIRGLPARERIAGIAEAVKVALIRDRVFFEWLEANANRLATFDEAAERYMIRRCAALHMRQIGTGGDPFEMGSARPLDFGHWAAHKLEALTRHHLRHGEAVAIGIALDTRYSVLSGLLPAGEDERVVALLEHLGFRIHHPALERTNAEGRSLVLAGLDEFREHLGGELTITLLSTLGTGVEVHEIAPERVADAIDWLAAREGG
ncbi:MAG: 3-dehydroquinate synthase [Pseudomonadota bacterium]